jgi:hypothetical protein
MSFYTCERTGYTGEMPKLLMAVAQKYTYQQEIHVKI